MAYTSPRTWSSGETVTDVIMNSAVRDNLLWIAGTTGVITQSVYASSATVETTTSSTPVVMTNPVATITPGGGDLLLFAGVSLANSTVAATSDLSISADGSVLTGSLAHWTQPVANYFVALSLQFRIPSPSAVSHTYGLGWATNAGTLTTTALMNRWMLVLEIRR